MDDKTPTLDEKINELSRVIGLFGISLRQVIEAITNMEYLETSDGELLPVIDAMDTMPISESEYSGIPLNCAYSLDYDKPCNHKILI